MLNKCGLAPHDEVSSFYVGLLSNELGCAYCTSSANEWTRWPNESRTPSTEGLGVDYRQALARVSITVAAVMSVDGAIRGGTVISIVP